MKKKYREDLNRHIPQKINEWVVFKLRHRRHSGGR